MRSSPIVSFILTFIIVLIIPIVQAACDYDGFCDLGESVYGCEDCCESACNGITVPGEIPTFDNECHSWCDGYNSCNFYDGNAGAACGGEELSTITCYDEDSYLTCCEGTPVDCDSDEYCENGGCINCDTACNGVCDSSACYGDDPDCNAQGQVAGTCCGDGICTETHATCPADCDLEEAQCEGIIEVVVEDSEGSGLNGQNITLNGALQGSTDSIGKLTIAVAQHSCGEKKNVTAWCASGAFCDSEIETNTMNETDYVLFTCDLCKEGYDLYFYQSDIVINHSSDEIKVTVHSRGIDDFIQVNLFTQKEDTSSDDGENLWQTIDISPGESKTVTFTFSGGISFDDDEYIHVYLDPDNDVNESDETNNYLFRTINRDVKIYPIITLDRNFQDLETPIREYLSSFVTLVNDSASADFTVRIEPVYITNNTALTSGRFITVDGLALGGRYTAIIDYGTYDYKAIYVIGTNIEGIIAGVKRLINARDYFFTPLGDPSVGAPQFKRSIIDDTDTLGIGIYDQLHTSEFEPDFFNGELLTNKVRKILTDNNFEVAIKTVQTLNSTSYGERSTLRLKNVNSDYSQTYKDAINSNNRPVVFSGGIYSRLESWELDGGTLLRRRGLARLLASQGRDTWEIEMTGGPNVDCITCINYTYADLNDFYWPALIAGVLNYTGKDQIDYVGHSNGCRVALTSLNDFPSGKTDAGYVFDLDTGSYIPIKLIADPIYTFFGLGCPLMLNNHSYVGDNMNNEISGVLAAERSIELLNATGVYHPQKRDVALRMDIYSGLIVYLWDSIWTDNNAISLNLQEFYNDLYITQTSNVDLSNVYFQEAYILGGNRNTDPGIVGAQDNDDAVPLEDINYLYNNLPADESHKLIFNTTHGGLMENYNAKKYLLGVMQ